MCDREVESLPTSLGAVCLWCTAAPGHGQILAARHSSVIQKPHHDTVVPVYVQHAYVWQDNRFQVIQVRARSADGRE